MTVLDVPCKVGLGILTCDPVYVFGGGVAVFAALFKVSNNLLVISIV